MVFFLLFFFGRLCDLVEMATATLTFYGEERYGSFSSLLDAVDKSLHSSMELEAASVLKGLFESRDVQVGRLKTKLLTPSQQFGYIKLLNKDVILI